MNKASTGLGAVVILALAAGGISLWKDFRRHELEQAEKLAETQRKLEEEKVRNAVLEQVLDRMTKERVIADIVVLDQRSGPQGLETIIRIYLKGRVGTDPSDEAAHKTLEYTIQGDKIYFEAYTLRFGDAFIAEGDPRRGKSLNLLTRVFGEHQAPADGFIVEDASKTVPHYYSLGDPKLENLEQELWERFWHYTTHREEALKAGVEVAHGQAPFTQFKKSLLYELVADNRGNLTLRQR
jgi:hypothetical protein